MRFQYEPLKRLQRVVSGDSASEDTVCYSSAGGGFPNIRVTLPKRKVSLQWEAKQSHITQQTSHKRFTGRKK